MDDIVRSVRIIRHAQKETPSSFSSYRLKERTEMPSNMVLHLTYTDLDNKTVEFIKRMFCFGEKKQICIRSHNMDMYLAIRGSKMRLKVIAHRNVELYRMVFQFAMGLVQHYTNALEGKGSKESSSILMSMLQ